MKQVIITRPAEVAILSETIGEGVPVFSKKNGKLTGMLICEDKKWIHRIGGGCGASGWHTTRDQAMQADFQYGYTFFIED